jgi:hypothetical protein
LRHPSTSLLLFIVFKPTKSTGVSTEVESTHFLEQGFVSLNLGFDTNWVTTGKLFSPLESQVIHLQNESPAW